ncbi:MAG: hypothetical protein DRJ47_01020 [Thermoprotei archaeon]|nr:MAG: hypothetical protein DRJ47_01020 [Thermoprotei archaeon]
MDLYSTHVGSYPSKFSVENIRKIFLDTVEIGLDYPPHPQLRDFIYMYLEPLIKEGILERRGESYKLIAEFNVEDIPEPKVVEQDIVVKLSSERKLHVKGKRACITGPFTLSSRIAVSGEGLGGSLLYAKSKVLDYMVEYTRLFTLRASKLGYEMIVVDEPILSVIVGRRILFEYTVEDICSALQRLFEGVSSKYKGVHVCGRLSPKVREILLNVETINILDHEHKDHPANISLYSYEDLESYNKYMALGVLSSTNPSVEKVDDIVNRIKDGLKTYRERLLFVKSDCGFKGLSGYMNAYQISLNKLKNLVEALKIVKKEV